MRLKEKRPFIMQWSAVILVGLACSAVICAPSFAGTQWDVGASGGSKGIDSFHVSIGEYYHVPEREVIIIRDRGIDEEDLPVVLYISQRAHVPPGAVVELRLKGMNWMDITLHFGLSPEIYYVPVRVLRHGPPYGHAYGYYRNHPKGKWNKIVLRDQDIVNQVNLKFISEHYGYAPERIMKYRSDGRRFTVIDQDIRHERHGRFNNKGLKDTRQKERGGPKKKNH